jgi:hypothetical protein
MSTWVAETTNGYCSTRHRHINDDMVRAGPPPSIDMMRQNDCLLGVSVGFLLPLSVGRCAPTVQFRLWAATLSSSGSFVTFVVTLLKRLKPYYTSTPHVEGTSSSRDIEDEIDSMILQLSISTGVTPVLVIFLGLKPLTEMIVSGSFRTTYSLGNRM